MERLFDALTLALFLALMKRRGEVILGMDDGHRPSLRGYSVQFLDQAMGITAGMALLAYALYCIEADPFLPGREFASLPFVAFGILEYLRIAQTAGTGRNPVELALRHPSLLLAGAGWLATAAWSLGVV